MEIEFINACLNGDLDEIAMFIDSNPGLVHNVFGFEAVIVKGYLEAVKYFVGKGATLNSVTTSSIIWAAHNKHIKVINYLRKIAGDEWKCHNCIVKSTCLDLCDNFNNIERNST
jgi:ankyrin repeat protein